jgi:hypothetical protein
MHAPAWNPSKKGARQYLCSGHFNTEDFNTSGKLKKLEDGVVPHKTYFPQGKENSSSLSPVNYN